MSVRVAVEAEAVATVQAQAVMPEGLVEPAGPAWAIPAQGLEAQATAQAARLLVKHSVWNAKAARLLERRSGCKAKATARKAAMQRRTEERGGTRLHPHVHAAAPPHFASSWSF
jgi:hypothetical protein